MPPASESVSKGAAAGSNPGALSPVCPFWIAPRMREPSLVLCPSLSIFDLPRQPNPTLAQMFPVNRQCYVPRRRLPTSPGQALSVRTLQVLLRAIHPMSRTLGCSSWQCWRTCRLIRSLDSGNEALSGCVGLVLKVGKTVLDGAPEFRTAGLMRPFFKKIFRSHRRVRDRAVLPVPNNSTSTGSPQAMATSQKDALPRRGGERQGW